MYDEINSARLKEYRDAFDMFDRDRDGVVTSRELASVIKSVIRDIGDVEIKQMIQEVDIDGNGVIDFEEFVVMMNRRNKETDAEDDVINAFRVFDSDADGIISSTELRHIMTTLGDKLNDAEVDEMIREADVDNNGLIYYEEFVRMMMTK